MKHSKKLRRLITAIVLVLSLLPANLLALAAEAPAYPAKRIDAASTTEAVDSAVNGENAMSESEYPVDPSLGASSACSGCLLGTFSGVPACVSTDGKLHVCENNFPDPVFREYVATLNGADDDYFTQEGANGIDQIVCTLPESDSPLNIKSVQGIEFFTELTGLSVGRYSSEDDKGLTELNVSNNRLLRYLNCDYNHIQELDVSMLTNLETLFCQQNLLKELNVSNTQLQELYCSGNQLSALDISGLQKLEIADCSTNYTITKLDASDTPKLKELSCRHNALTELNVNNMPALVELDCSYNNLTTLSVTTSPSLTFLDCNNNALSRLNIDNGDSLTVLRCADNALSELNLQNMPVLEELDCSYNDLTSLDLTNNAKLTTLSCYVNQLKTLNISHNAQLTYIGCDKNQLTELDVSRNMQLNFLECAENDLTVLDLSQNIKLTALNCPDNRLTQLVFGDIPDFSYLNCQNNALTKLDLSQQPALTDLQADGNPLLELELSSAIPAQQLDDIYVKSTQQLDAVLQNGVWVVDLSDYIAPENLDRIAIASDGASYDNKTGIVSFDREPSVFLYVYNSGSKEVLVTFEVAVSEKECDHVAGNWETTVEPTCTKPGSAVQKCMICGTVLNQKELPSLGHSFGSWIVDEPVTCTMYGHRYRVCSICGEKEEEWIEPTGHVPGEVIMTKEPTCTEWGSSERCCTVCGDILELADYPPLGHSFGNWIVDKAPTATEPGSQHRECSVCGYRETQTLAPVQVRRKAQVMVSSLNVRSSASSSSASVVKLVKNELAYIDGESGNWYLVSFTKGGKQYRGYLPKQYVKIIAGEAKDKGAVIAKSANVYTSTAANKVETTLDRELLVYIDGEAGDYYLVSFSWNGWHYGYVKKDYIRDASLPADYESVYSSHQALVMTDEVIVRDADGNPVTVLYKNNKVYINEVLDNGQYKVSFTQYGEPFDGYVGKQYFRISSGAAKEKGAVIAKNANVYTSTAATKVESTLSRKLLVYIDQEVGDYYLVSFSWNGWHYGYILKDYVRDAGLPANYKSVYSSHQALVMTDEVIVRDADGNPVTVLYENNKVYINEVLDDGRYKVSFTQYGEPFEGYVGKQYFRISSGAAKPAGTITADVATIYTDTDKTSVESTLRKGLRVYIDKEEGDYYLVSFSWDGWHYGYIDKADVNA